MRTRAATYRPMPAIGFLGFVSRLLLGVFGSS